MYYLEFSIESDWFLKKKWDKDEKTKYKCTHIYVKGLNKGLVCGKTITKNVDCGFCVTHSKQKEKEKEKET